MEYSQKGWEDLLSNIRTNDVVRKFGSTEITLHFQSNPKMENVCAAIFKGQAKRFMCQHPCKHLFFV